MEDVPDSGGGDGEPYICLNEDRESQVWVMFGHTNGSLPQCDNKLSRCFQSCWGKHLCFLSPVLSLCVFVFLTVTDAMGQMTSSPLDLLLICYKYVNTQTLSPD